MGPHEPGLERRLLPFSEGSVVPTLVVRADTDAHAVARALDLPPYDGVVVVNGGTRPLDERLRDRVVEALRGVAAAVADRDLAIVSGGTDAGVFAVLGDVVVGARAMIGVAPLSAVRLPVESVRGAGEVALERHHSHFVLVQGRRWGAETPMMLGLTTALGDRVGSVAVLVGGGSGALDEVRGHVRAGRTVLVLPGTGRLADQIADAAATAASGPSGTSVLERVAASPFVRVVPWDASGGTVTDLVLRALEASRSR